MIPSQKELNERRSNSNTAFLDAIDPFNWFHKATNKNTNSSGRVVREGKSSGGFSSGRKVNGNKQGGGVRGEVQLSKPNTNNGSKYGGVGGGVSAGSRIDLTPYINALKEGAAANKQTLQDTYNSQRNQLSTQLKQQQENTANARRQLMDAFNASRADLEETAYMNNRAAQQNAAARGLGGSGLQQLAQLSSQIESSKQTSDLAKANTESQNTLTKDLKDITDKINNSINDLTTEQRNKETEIDKNVAQAIAAKQYEEEVRYQNALQQAAAANASIAASARSAAQSKSDDEAIANAVLEGTYRNGLESIKSVFNKNKGSKKLSDLLEDARSTAAKDLNTAYGTYGLGNVGALDTYLSQLQSATNDYASQGTYKPSSFGAWLSNLWS